MKINILAICFLLVALISCDKLKENDKVENAKTEQKLSKEELIDSARVIISEAQGLLIKNLIGAIEKGGVENAIDFCNVNALNLTSSIADKYDINLSRKSIKNRNPDNLFVDYRDSSIYKYLIDNPNELYYQTIDTEEFKEMKYKEYKEIVVYKAIFTQPACMMCHGQVGRDIKLSDYELIKAKYPDDKAIDFEVGDLRGVWEVVFKEKKDN